MSARDYFLGKRIAVVGLGPHGEMLSDAKYLIKANALVSVYDIRAEARIRNHIAFLRSIGLANHVCGTVPADDLLDMDLIILSHEYPRDSSFLAEANRKGIQIEYPETLFLKLAPPVAVVAVMGSCGKATIVSMLSPMIEAACASAVKNDPDARGQACFTADPETGDGILSHLKKMKNGDILVMRIAESIQSEIAALGWSPQTAVFTTVPPPGTFYASPFEILEHQTYNNYAIGSDYVIDAVRSSSVNVKAKLLRTKAALIPTDWGFKGRAAHDIDNAALALQAARVFKVSDEIAQAVFARWKPLKGHLEPVKKIRNIEFYNDTASMSPDATVSGLTSLSEHRNVVLIAGGADRGSDYREFRAALPQYAHTLIVVPGSGTLRERAALRGMENIEVVSVPSIEEAARAAFEHARKGDRVLFSPAFAAVGIDGSRTERGERFVRAVRAL